MGLIHRTLATAIVTLTLSACAPHFDQCTPDQTDAFAAVEFGMHINAGTNSNGKPLFTRIGGGRATELVADGDPRVIEELPGGYLFFDELDANGNPLNCERDPEYRLTLAIHTTTQTATRKSHGGM